VNAFHINVKLHIEKKLFCSCHISVICIFKKIYGVFKIEKYCLSSTWIGY